MDRARSGASPTTVFSATSRRCRGDNQQLTRPSEELDADIEDAVDEYSDRLRTYSARDYTTGDVACPFPRLAKQYGLTRDGEGAWLSTDKEANELEQIKYADRNRCADNDNIDRVMVGNETLLRGDLTVAGADPATSTPVKRRARVPVSTAESWDIWLPQFDQREEEGRCTSSRVIVDFITVHLLPYWEGIPRARRRSSRSCSRYDRDAARISEQARS